MKSLVFYFMILILMLEFASCHDSDLPKNISMSINIGDGFFITNEGVFQQANASVSYYHWEQDSIYTDIYETINNEKLGDILQSMFIYNESAYLVMNNSAWIDVVNIDDFEKKGEIRGFVSPRYFYPVSELKAYVSDLYSGIIYVVDLDKNKISKEINSGKWTEKMAFADNKLYVTCPWKYSKPLSGQVLIVDTENDEIIDSLDTGINPGDIGFDSNGYLWTLNNGNNLKNIPGSIFKIDVNTKEVVDSFVFDNILHIYNASLEFNEIRDSIFVLYDNVYKFSANEKINPEKIVSRDNENYYGMNVDNVHNVIVITDAGDFAEKGKLHIYSKNGKPVRILNAGYLPNSIVVY